MDKWDKIKKKDLKSLGEAPVESSENIQAPELAPRDNRFTGRTKRIAFTCRPEFAEELRKMAFEKRCYQIEVLEKAMEIYKKNLFAESGSFAEHEKKENHSLTEIKAKIPKTKPKPPKTSPQSLNQFWKVNFACDKCYQRFEKSIVFSLAPNLDELPNYPHYCSNCKETIEIPETCSFREKNEQTNQYTPCNKPLFDKKKQLCRSHNRQVRNKFNEFTKDMSISSMAAWEMQWEQSSDWRYFWGLGEGGE